MIKSYTAMKPKGGEKSMRRSLEKVQRRIEYFQIYVLMKGILARHMTGPNAFLTSIHDECFKVYVVL
jgi:hypothetical protein